MSTSINKTTTKHQEFADKWERCRDVVKGRRAILEAGEDYLPKLDSMEDDEYSAYQKRAGWYGATAGTKGAFKGMILRKDPVIEVPDGMDDFEEDATLSGTSLKDLTSDILDEVLEVGRCGVLVDHESQQEKGDRPRTRAEVEQSNLRPYLTMYKAEQILPPKMGYVNNKYVVTQLRLREWKTVESKDEFDEDYRLQIRVLDLDPDNSNRYRVRLFERDSKDEEKNEDYDRNDMKFEGGSFSQVGDDIYPKMNGQHLDYIPFTFINATNQSHEYEKPPLYDLAELNLDYYRTKADYKHGLHFTGLPTAVITGHKEDDKVFRIGSATAWQLENPEADAKYLEFTGQGLEELSSELNSLKDEMASLGARMLATEKRQPEAAEAHAIKRTGEHSLLASIANNITEALTEASERAREWYDASGDASVQVNTDFIADDLSAEDVVKLINAAQSAGPFTTEDLLWNLRKGERLDPSMDDDERMSKMQTEPPTDMNFNGNGESNE